MPGKYQNLNQYAAESIDPDEDDIDDDDDDDVVLKVVEKMPIASDVVAATPTAKGKTAFSVGAIVVQQGVAAVSPLVTAGNSVSSLAPVAVALTPALVVTGPIGIALSMIESGFSAYSAVQTYKHIKNLEQIIEDKGSVALEGTCEAIVFCCKQKNKKLKHKGVGCLPVLGSICNTVYAVGRSAQKSVNKTKGVERLKQTATLWANTLEGDKCAIAACQELLGEKVYSLIAGLSDGHVVLKAKLKSI